MSVAVRPAPTAPTAEVPTELTFVTPPPGMMNLRRFSLTALDDTGFLFALRSLDEPAVRLFLVPPQAYFPHYTPRLDATVEDSLDLEGEPVVLVVVHPGQDQAGPTANLLAPVVVNPATGAAVQVVLDDDRWPLRAELSSAAA